MILRNQENEASWASLFFCYLSISFCHVRYCFIDSSAAKPAKDKDESTANQQDALDKTVAEKEAVPVKQEEGAQASGDMDHNSGGSSTTKDS